MDLDSVRRDLVPTGTLRAVLNFGNPVLTSGTPQAPGGITVDIARAIAARLDVPVSFTCVDAARKSFDALSAGAVDIAFLAVEPARAAQVAFSAPYLVIEGVYAVPRASTITSVAEVDRAGVRIGVKLGSAYDLFLTRTLTQATLVRGEESTTVFLAEGLDAVAGIRAPLTEFVAEHPALRLIDERFMQIQQAVAVGPDAPPQTIEFLSAVGASVRNA